MSDYEELEALGQTNIFDFLEVTPKKRNKSFIEGDNVKIRFYIDEIEFVEKNHPELLKVGKVIGKQHDFYVIQINEITLHVDGEKLILA